MMDFIKERLSIYNDRDVFNKYINDGIYEIINYSDLGNDYVFNNQDLIISLIKNGKYILSSISPSNIKNNYLFYIASFEFGNLNPLFFYKGDISVFDDFFKLHSDLINIGYFNNRFKLKKILDFNCYIRTLYFDDLNKEICNGNIDFLTLKNNDFYEKIVIGLSDDSIKKLYGNNTLEFVKRYGYDIILSDKYKFICDLSMNELNRFFDLFKVRNGSVINLINLYNAFVDYNFVYKSSLEILNGHSFSLIKPNNMEYVELLIKEINENLSENDKKLLLDKYSLFIDDLISKYIKLFDSNDYKKFNLYSSIIREICNLAYNRKRELFVSEKMNFDNGFPFDISVSLKMKKNINKKKLMSNVCLDVAYNYDKLLELKKYLVNNGIVDNDFDTNVLFALLTDGVKGIKLIDLSIDKNYLIGKIYGYISSLIDNSKLDCDISFDEYCKLPLNDDCFVVNSNISEIVNEIDLKKFLDGVIRCDDVYNLFKKYVDKYDLLYYTSSLKLCDVCYCGDVSYSCYNLVMLINNFGNVCYDSSKNIYSVIFDMMKKSAFINNPLNRYERIFGESNKWIISDPSPNSSFIDSKGKIDVCLDVYKKMLDRQFISVPVLSFKCDGLTITNDNFYNDEMLISGEKLGSCMRAGGTLDNLFKYTLISPNGFNIVIRKDDDLISRIAGVCFGNSIFLNELREDVSGKYSNDCLFSLLKKYVNLLVCEAKKNNHVIEQVFITSGIQGTRDIRDGIVKNDFFWELKNGKYGFNMDYTDEAICLYGDGDVKPVKFDSNYYVIPRFKTLCDDMSIWRINMLRALYNDEWDYVSEFDKCICGVNWYVYSINGIVDSYISDGNMSIDNLECFENARNVINYKKNV